MNSQEITLTRPGGFEASPHAAHHGGRRGIVPFVGHFGEMFVAMMLGMPLLGMPLAALQGALLGPSSYAIPELRAFGMAVAMTIPMVAWMRYRGHAWRPSVEMGAAMIVPTLALFPLYWAGLIPGRSLSGLEMALMLPAMLGAMIYRRHEYGL
ncbi:MAG TPA: hypothetical protein VIV06_07695 [Candidatus Limnocylindrales bacterium]